MFLNPQRPYRFAMHQQDSSGQDLRCSIPNIMKAILLTAGPISNATSFLNCASKYMRKVTVDQYKEAALRLQEANLGQYITVVIGHSRPKEIFIKATPNEALHILTRTPIVTPIDYIQRFFLAVPNKILTGMRRKLVELGYVTEEQMFGDKNVEKYW